MGLLKEKVSMTFDRRAEQGEQHSNVGVSIGIEK